MEFPEALDDEPGPWHVQMQMLIAWGIPAALAFKPESRSPCRSSPSAPELTGPSHAFPAEPKTSMQ